MWRPVGSALIQAPDPGQPGLPDSPDGLDARTGGVVRVAVVVDVLPCARHRAHRNAEGGRIRFPPRLWRHRRDGHIFVILGAHTMYGSGDGILAGSGVSFAQKLIKLYTAAMGGWSTWVIIPAAFSAMFGTTLTCLDAYPRSIAAIQGLLRHHDSGDSVPWSMQRRFDMGMIVHFLAAVIRIKFPSNVSVYDCNNLSLGWKCSQGKTINRCIFYVLVFGYPRNFLERY